MDTLERIAAALEQIALHLAPKAPKPRVTKQFEPPTVEEVRTYCSLKEYRDFAEEFVNYYGSSDPPWHDGNGKPVRNWKAKANLWGSRSKTNGSTKPHGTPRIYPPAARVDRSAGQEAAIIKLASQTDDVVRGPEDSGR